MKPVSVKKTVWAGVCLALCLILPFLTGQIPAIGKALSPMHIPVLLCGFLCGWPYGLIVGMTAPLLRFALFGMPPLFPTGLAMAVELAVYGACSGYLYRKLPGKIIYLYASLIGAMLAGRVAWGITQAVLLGFSGKSFAFSAFLAGAFVNAVPGIVCHIVLIPLIVLAIKKAGLNPADS